MPNVYFLIFFACDREARESVKGTGALNPNPAYKWEAARGNGVPIVSNKSVTNFTFVFGCGPGKGLVGRSKFASDLLKLFVRNFDLESGKLTVP
jgi:hypothetical protein